MVNNQERDEVVASTEPNDENDDEPLPIKWANTTEKTSNAQKKTIVAETKQKLKVKILVG